VTKTYDPTVLATSAKDRIRHRIGDVRTKDAVLEDEEIAYELSLSTNEAIVALRCARLALNRVRQDVDSSGAGVNVSRSQKFQHFKDVISELELEAMGTVNIVLTGASKAERDALAEDPDVPEAPFSIGMDRHPER
jgi:hypothetical protein